MLSRHMKEFSVLFIIFYLGTGQRKTTIYKKMGKKIEKIEIFCSGQQKDF